MGYHHYHYLPRFPLWDLLLLVLQECLQASLVELVTKLLAVQVPWEGPVLTLSVPRWPLV